VILDFESIQGHLKHNFKVKETKLKDSRLLTTYSIDPFWSNQQPFYLILNLKKTLLLFVWQSISKTFKKLKQFPIPDVCKVLALRGTVVTLGTQTEYHCISIDDAANIQEMCLPLVLGTHHIVPLDVIHLEKELIVCYNSNFFFFKKKRKVISFINI